MCSTFLFIESGIGISAEVGADAKIWEPLHLLPLPLVLIKGAHNFVAACPFSIQGKGESMIDQMIKMLILNTEQ